MKKPIANIVFYKFWGEQGEMQQACIFYEDGTVKNVSFEEGLEESYDIIRSENITSQEEFKKLVNSRRIYSLSGKEFERRFQEFRGRGLTIPQQTPGKTLTTTQPVYAPISKPTAQETKTTKQPVTAPIVKEAAKSKTTTTNYPYNLEEDQNSIATGAAVFPHTGDQSRTPKGKRVPKEVVEKGKIIVTNYPYDLEEDEEQNLVADENEAAFGYAGTGVGTPQVQESTENEAEQPKKGLFKRMWVKVTALILAGVMLFTGGYHLGKRNRQNPYPLQTTTTQTAAEDSNTITLEDQPYLNLLARTTEIPQKEIMQAQSVNIDTYNRDFANKYIEEGKDVKAGLTWDETVALNLAYNDYTKDQIKVMFNGAEVDSTAMMNAYKNATLQLMGAYVISTRENPVNSSKFLVNEKHQKFVEKYNDLFLNIKEANGKDRVTALNAFYKELHQDFPISDKIREEGISHADSRKQVESYKAAVSPIVAAAEIMFQNTSGIDHTLSDKAIAYFNDLGLCNLVEDKFERAEVITLSAATNDKQPLYEDYRSTKIEELKTEGNYPIDDMHRDLSRLAEFQKWVNGHFKFEKGINTGVIVATKTKTYSSSYTKTTTKTETSTTKTDSRKEAVDKAGEEAVKEAEKKAGKEIERDNAKKEEEAKKEADKKSDAAKKEEAADAADMQDKIDKANDDIENGNKVNEGDFGDHDVDFDDEFEDGNGNLDDSVKDITTDGNGAKTENDLPDPNKTGEAFDSQAPTSNSGTSNNVPDSENSVENSNGGSSSSGAGQDIYEYEEPYTYTAARVYTNEEIVDAYIASLEGVGSDEAVKVYIR